jgi:TRAP-type C4-dicarboxylate transport system permease small subunit
MDPGSLRGQRGEWILDRITGTISSVLVSTAAVALVGFVIVFVVYIIARTVFNVGWMFVEEYTQYFMVLVIFFALLYTLRTEGHMKVTIITRVLPKRVRDILEVVTALLSLIIVVYMTHKATLWFWHGVVDDVHALFRSNTLLWPIYLLPPIGLAALSLGLLVEFLRSGSKLVKGEGKDEITEGTL